MLKISLLFFFSGIAALTYEVLWVRHLGLIFGNTVYAASTVMMTYMFGLALGAHFAGKWAIKVKRPVWLFGVLEVAVAAYALCVPLIFELIKILYRFAALHISDGLIFLTMVRVVLALILLLIPTAMMGATLPVLSKGFLARVERFGSRLGILYGVNTLGAVTGVLLSGFVLIPRFGMTVSNIVAVCMDASVGLIAMLASRTLDQTPEIIEAVRLEAGLTPSRQRRGGRANWLLLAVGASGFLALAFEVVWFRALILVFGSTTYSFSAMLSVYLVGLSVGSMIISRFADKVKYPALLFGISAMLTGVYTLISLNWFTAMPEFLLRNLMLKNTPDWGTMISLKFVITLIFLFVPTVFFGASFTSGVKAIRSAMDSSPRAVGEAAMFNTVGAAFGALIGGFVLLPTFGMQHSLTLCAFLILVLGLVLCQTAGAGKRAELGSLGLAAVTLGCFIISPPHWDKKVLSSGPYFTPWGYIRDGKVVYREELQKHRLIYYNEGITSTIAVYKDANENYSYCSQGKVEADTSDRSMMLQRMMGHLPMLFHPNPQRVLNIGLGAGVTLGALSCYPAEHLEVVEFEPSVVNAAEIWGSYNHHVIDNPKIRITINDGRNHLFIGGKPYDVITSDPFEPVMAGAANLYTVDFFEQVKAQLADGGIMAQYLPLYELSREDYATIMRSFAKVFPDCLLFFTGFDTILLGGKGDTVLRMPVARSKFDIPQVKASLAEVGFTRPEMLLSMFVARLKVDDTMFAAGKLNTDRHPVIEFSAPKHVFHYTSDRNQRVLLDNFSAMPDELLEGLSDEQRKTVLDAHEAMKMTLQANIYRAKNDYKSNIELLIKAAERVPDNPVVKNELAASLMVSANSVAAQGYLQQAVAQYQLLLKYKPKSFWPIYHLVGLNMRLRNFEAAKKYLEYGLRTFPESPLFIELRGKYRGTMGDAEGACEDIRAALDELPDYLPFWQDYEYFLRLKGDHAGALIAQKQIIRLSR